MPRKTLSLDLRERILQAYDQGEGTQAEVAHRFKVSYGMVKKLIQQRRHLGDIAPLHHRAGRKPQIAPSHRSQLRGLLAKKPDLTLKELRTALGVDCTVQAIHYVLADMGLTYKKRRFGRVKRIARKSPARGGRGAGANSGSTQRA